MRIGFVPTNENEDAEIFELETGNSEGVAYEEETDAEPKLYFCVMVFGRTIEWRLK